MILDTDFLIALDSGESSAVEMAEELESRDVPLRIPTVVIQELYVAVGLGTNSFENARKYEELVANKPVVALDETIARRAGALEGTHLASDRKPTLGQGDAIIAATGLQYDEAVVTSDADFSQVEGLRVEKV